MNYTISPFTLIVLGYHQDPNRSSCPSQTLRCPGACGSRQRGHVVIFDYMPINIGTFPILPTGLHGLCFGFCFAGPLPLRSLLHGLLLRVPFGESLVLDYTQKSTISTLAVKLSVSAIIYPGGLPHT